MSYLDETDPRWSDASRARRRAAAPDSHSPNAGHGYAERSGRSPEPEPWSEPEPEPEPESWSEEPAQAPLEQQSAEPRPAGAGGSRAGRNVPLSIVVGLTMLVVVLSPLFFWKPGFLLVLIIAAGVGVWEMATAVRTSGAKPPLIPLIGGSVAMMSLAWFSGVDALSLGLLVAALATFVWRMGDGPAGYQRDMGAATLILVYVPFLLGFAALLAAPDDGHWRIVVTLAAVVLSDTGGFVAGVLLGKHPMAPTISPKKSWEGFAGSVLATAIGSALLLYSLFDVALWLGAGFGVLVSIAAVLGDLSESLLKRDLGIKDMSNLLPAHGGVMDRLDSIVFAAPTAYLLLYVLVPTA
jgi:phosphatidate cytidylyltransferase